MKKLTNPLLFIIQMLIVLSVMSVAYSNNRENNPLDDAVITAKIIGKLAKEPLLNPFKVIVKTEKGEVSLSGEVETNLQYSKAVELAEATNGVTDVNTDAFTVKNSQQPLTDTLITAKVKGKLMKESYFGKRGIDSSAISVETKNGIVYLTGKTNTAAQKAKVIQIANSVKNVHGVEDGLTVAMIAG